MNDLQLIIGALNFAAQEHRDQMRKGAHPTPYIHHPIALAHILTVEGGVLDPVVIAAALLHDTIEDCEVLPTHLAQLFGQEVADVVSEVTDDKALPKAKRKELQVEHAPHASHKAKQRGNGESDHRIWTNHWYMGFAMREGVSVRAMEETFATTGQIGFFCHARVDVFVTYPAVFAAVTGIRP
jgi:hypothetical protein